MTRLDRLPPGARFRVPGIERTGTLLYADASRARVRWDVDADTERVAFEANGRPVSFAKRRGRDVNIAPGCEVEVING